MRFLTRKTWLAISAGAVCLGIGAAVWVINVARSAPAGDLLAKPSGISALAVYDWGENVLRESDDIAVGSWAAWTDSHERLTYFEEVTRYSNSVAARWHYAGSARVNFEEDFPDDIVDLERPDQLSADASDIYCVDIEKTYAASRVNCETWVYWARYGQYRVYLTVDGGAVPKDKFLDVVVEVDRHIVATLR